MQQLLLDFYLLCYNKLLSFILWNRTCRAVDQSRTVCATTEVCSTKRYNGKFVIFVEEKYTFDTLQQGLIERSEEEYDSLRHTPLRELAIKSSTQWWWAGENKVSWTLDLNTLR